MASASTPSANVMSQQGPPLVQLKPIIKAQISGRMVSSGISDVAFASVHSEKTCLKKLIIMMMIIIIARISGFFCRAAERHFHRLPVPINVSVDLKYGVLCL